MQAGKQLEWMTGGYIKAGFHEVVCTQATLDVSLPIAAIGPQAYIQQAMARRKSSHPDRPQNRISSTFVSSSANASR